jgi:hypothetical protein
MLVSVWDASAAPLPSLASSRSTSTTEVDVPAHVMRQTLLRRAGLPGAHHALTGGGLDVHGAFGIDPAERGRISHGPFAPLAHAPSSFHPANRRRCG